MLACLSCQCTEDLSIGEVDYCLWEEISAYAELAHVFASPCPAKSSSSPEVSSSGGNADHLRFFSPRGIEFLPPDSDWAAMASASLRNSQSC
jgi:hypothetical protein